MKSRLKLLRYLGLLLLAVLILIAGPGRMLSVAAEANPFWILLAFLLNIPQLGLKAFRWFLLVRWQGWSFTYPKAFLAYFGSLLVGFLTPGRLGEMAKAFTLRHESGVPLAHGLSSVVVDRVFDMYLLLTLGTLGVIRFAIAGNALPWPVFLTICACLPLPLLFLHPALARRAAVFLSKLPVLQKRREMILEKAGQFAEGLSVLRPARIFISAFLTVAAYSVFFLQCLCCAWALGFTIPVVDLVLMMSASNFISFIPITVSGLGTREACLTFFLSQVQPPQTQAVAVTYGLSLFLVLFVGGGLIGFICWQLAPLGLQQAMKDFRHSRKEDADPA
jgi:uncharacterized protein (TIRG00374 family)